MVQTILSEARFSLNLANSLPEWSWPNKSKLPIYLSIKSKIQELGSGVVLLLRGRVSKCCSCPTFMDWDRRGLEDDHPLKQAQCALP